jgi:polyferredoxin
MAKLSGWQRFTVVLIGTWMLSVAALSTYEYATSKDGTFIGLVFPLQSIMSTADEPKSKAIGQGRESEIATERFVRWRILVGALVLPFATLLGISLLSKFASWLSTKH